MQERSLIEIYMESILRLKGDLHALATLGDCKSFGEFAQRQYVRKHTFGTDGAISDAFDDARIAVRAQA